MATAEVENVLGISSLIRIFLKIALLSHHFVHNIILFMNHEQN